MSIFKDPSPSRARSPFGADRPGVPAAPIPSESPERVRAALVEQAKRMPKEPGVYLWKDADGVTLYVGKAKDLRARVRSYLSGPHEVKTERMVDEATTVEFIAVHSEKEALILEQTLIKRERPRYNVRLTDDKKYPYIMVTDEEFPRVVFTRDVSKQEGVYFGPFPDAWAAKQITRLLNQTFQLRQCRTLPKRACIYHQMGQCLAPCITAVPDEVYASAAHDARSFLKGRGSLLVKELDARMHVASSDMKFEEAARLRDTKEAIASVLERQRVFAREREDRDVVGIAPRGNRACAVLMFVRDGRVVGRESYFLSQAEGASEGEMVGAFVSQYYGTALAVPSEILVPQLPEDCATVEEWLRERRGGAVNVRVPRRGDKLRVLEMAAKNAELLMAEDHFKRERSKGRGVDELQALLKLEQAPHTIDGFDISHHGGTHTVASMVRFLGGAPHKDMYRRYKIRDVKGIDDFASIKEAVKRRFQGLIERGDETPDLVLVDGGRGQLNAAIEALAELGLDDQPICSLAKREEEIYTPFDLHPIAVKADHEGRKLLERVRNEAHRFAIKYQDTLKRGALTTSALLEVNGVGEKRMQDLLRRFGSVRGVAAASEEELMTVPGVTADLARRIRERAGHG